MSTARLIIADTERDSNLLYATNLFCPDPFIYFELRGVKHVVMSDLEFDRAREKATVDRVLSLARCTKRLKSAGMKAPRLVDVVNRLFRDLRVRKVEVPASFPIGLAKKLRGVRVTVKADPFYPERDIKTAAEVRKLAHALSLAETGERAALNRLRATRIGRDGYLYWRGRKLTAEDLRGAINSAIADRGGVAAHTIVACGNQGCDPHEAGYGPVRAHKPIIFDIFPRDVVTGYWGDITRTMVRGRASDAVKKMYVVVGQAQQIAFDKLRDGVDGQEIHKAIQNLFKREGYPTRRRNGRMQGFFHGTGHGLGLDIHERPRIGAAKDIMRRGQVVTVEPGLYYWGVGGVRLEDVVLIQQRGVKLLTTFPKQLEI